MKYCFTEKTILHYFAFKYDFDKQIVSTKVFGSALKITEVLFYSSSVIVRRRVKTSEVLKQYFTKSPYNQCRRARTQIQYRSSWLSWKPSTFFYEVLFSTISNTSNSSSTILHADLKNRFASQIRSKKRISDPCL